MREDERERESAREGERDEDFIGIGTRRGVVCEKCACVHAPLQSMHPFNRGGHLTAAAALQLRQLSYASLSVSALLYSWWVYSRVMLLINCETWVL